MVITQMAGVDRNPVQAGENRGVRSYRYANQVFDSSPNFFKIFSNSKAKRQLVEASKAMAVYLNEKHIPNVIFIDSKARPAYLALIKTWHSLYPGTRVPSIYFINPYGLDKELRTPAEMLLEFKTTHKYLAAKRDEPVMIFDVCMHTGRTLKKVRNLLYSAGFRNISIGVGQQPDRDLMLEKGVWVDFVGLNCKVDKICNVFGSEGLIRRYSTHSVVAERAVNCRSGFDFITPLDEYLIGPALTTRHEISQILRK